MSGSKYERMSDAGILREIGMDDEADDLDEHLGGTFRIVAPSAGDRAAQLHVNGVHVECARRDCPAAGTVDRFHSHDYDGPLVCCDDE